MANSNCLAQTALKMLTTKTPDLLLWFYFHFTKGGHTSFDQNSSKSGQVATGGHGGLDTKKMDHALCSQRSKFSFEPLIISVVFVVQEKFKE